MTQVKGLDMNSTERLEVDAWIEAARIDCVRGLASLLPTQFVVSPRMNKLFRTRMKETLESLGIEEKDQPKENEPIMFRGIPIVVREQEDRIEVLK